MNLTVVSASRGDFKGTLLEQTLPKDIDRIVFEHNTRPLPVVYNEALESCAGPAAFIHDDVWLLYDPREALERAFRRYDVVGVAGGDDHGGPSWALSFDSELRPIGWWPRLSGACYHNGPSALTVYGEFGPVDLLDGLFIAVREPGNLRFDERYDFHCYDIDYCKAARLSGRRIGTWPIPLSHASPGNFDSSEFRRNARLYREKWR